MKPKTLQENDLIAVAAPAGTFSKKTFQKGISLLQNSGFNVTYRKDIFSVKGYLAGTDARRAKELNQHLSDPKSKSLLFARGGFGCQSLLPHLTKRCYPKVVCGSSDLTVLLNYLWKVCRLPSYYGPMVVPHLTEKKAITRLRQALIDPSFVTRQKIIAKEKIQPGNGEGILVGGCLSLVVSTLGTPWEIDTKGSLLFLEDTNEETYAIDRMLTQLEQAGKLKAVRGIVLGTFRQGKNLFPSSVKQLFQERFKKFRGPILWGLRFGHCKDPIILPFGGKGKIEGKRLVITKGIF